MSTTTEDLVKYIEQFLLLLSQKERFVIERRFNLDKKQRATLEEIGQRFDVTRERIRQIEKNALNKLRRNLENTPLKEVSDLAYQLINEAGGLLKEEILLSKILNHKSAFDAETLQLILNIDKRFLRIPNTVNFHPHLKFLQYTEALLHGLSKQVISLLKKHKDISNIKDLHELVKKTHDQFQEITLEAFTSFLLIDKKLKIVDQDKVGLVEWRHINPKTLRDKTYYVLRKEKKPLHFVDIANKIVDLHFDKKKVNLQAVHNELIRHNDFVLVGRGIYGLKEWGYQTGTVADIIENVLMKNGTMSQEDIVKEVLKQRHVKPITVILSLKNKKQFVRVGRRQYALAS